MTVPATSIVKSMAAAWNAGDAGRVLALAAQASGAEADSEGFLGLLGFAQQQMGEYPRAARTFERLVRMQPDVPAWWNNLGVAYRHAGDASASEQALLKAKSLAPRDAEVHYNLGLLYIQQQRWPLARETLLDAVQLAPQFVEARLEAAHACHVCGDIESERVMLEGADGWPPQPAAQALVLASILSVLGRLETALQVLARARVPEGSAARTLRLRIAAQRVALYERNNLLELAQRELQQVPMDALDALPADAVDARADGWRAHAVVAMREGRHADAAALYQRVLGVVGDDEGRATAAFGRAAALDRQARHDDAWQALGIAHAAQLGVVRQAAPELLKPDSQSLPMVTSVVDAAGFATWKPLAGPSMLQSPVFVIGFPRSGTTLLEQMLDAHPDFRSMDERGFIYSLVDRMQHVGQRYPADLAGLSQADADHLRATYFGMVAHALPDLGRHRLVDKNPLNMLCLPMILRLFPDARIILCIRHPCDVLLSCSMQAFRSPAFRAMCSSLPRLARGYTEAFEQCCGHIEVFKPNILEWRYESVVDDFDGAVTRLGQFLEVADASPFAGFAARARDKRFIATPSYAQVTQPVSAAAVGRWTNYREQFEPVLPVLRPWLERFGYAV
ncbi:MAG: sulfotransferase [Xanthomonadales bacterium]|nr:sulfotransferase [Xanthomonadales bacterium]ODU92117.1 MAG: sulfotransferase [Rhodanobacter sp. SCN 66-43]OJY86019.1 MAG: sulfotransferase [Xanthomonadales bacterium 66-474]